MILISNILVTVFLIVLPYFLFQGKYYISGDDTRLYYIYPYEYLVEFTFSSWHHFSSVGANGPTQFMMPFLILWSLLDAVIESKVILAYLGFSSPLILGFLFFQLFVRELVSKKYSFESLLGSLMFIASPILMSNQYFIFLSTIWLVPLLPLISYLYLKYISTGDKRFLAVLVISTFFMSLGLFSIPWVVGYILPIFLGAILIFSLIERKKLRLYIPRTLIFFGMLAATQFFWLFPFIMTYLGTSEVNFGSKVLSKDVMDTFSPTVLATATGNILYPMLNLFHRQIAMDFGWQLRTVFNSFFDILLPINAIFPAILFLGLFSLKKTKDKKIMFAYLLYLGAFAVALFLFTVNVGPLKNLFLYLGNIPGFVMFRNFYDKLGLSYILIYSVLICFSLVLIKNLNRKIYILTVIIFLSVISINFTRVGDIVNAPLWQTSKVGRNISISSEYLNFMSEVRDTVPSTSNILTIPFGTALYSVIKDANSDNVYVGTSPVKLFSGVNDFSGYLSFYFSDAKGIIENLIISRDYEGLKKILKAYNINYLFLNRNIPEAVLGSWIFDERMLSAQDQEFFSSIVENSPILVSENNNYELYKFKSPNILISSKNLSFQKINETNFRIMIKGLDKNQKLYFFDSYHNGWKIYPEKFTGSNWCISENYLDGVTECKEDLALFDLSELKLFSTKSIADSTHRVYTDFFVNQWTLNAKDIVNNYPPGYYKNNEDGSVDVVLRLYFQPQHYFYIGSILSLSILIGSLFYLLIKLIKK